MGASAKIETYLSLAQAAADAVQGPGRSLRIDSGQVHLHRRHYGNRLHWLTGIVRFGGFRDLEARTG